MPLPDRQIGCNLGTLDPKGIRAIMAEETHDPDAVRRGCFFPESLRPAPVMRRPF